MNSFLKYNLFSIFWTILILALCLMPGKDLPSISIVDFDKLVHFAVYFILAYSTYYGWKKQNYFTSLHNNAILKILILTSSYGFLVEIIQELFTSDRHFDMFDALANATGAAAGCYLTSLLKNKLIH